MKMTVFLVFLSIVTIPLFSFTVPSDELTTLYGISYEDRQKSNYIEKNGQSFQYLGNGTWDVRSLPSNTSASNNTTPSNSSGGGIIVVISIIHIILTFCVYKMKGPYWACFYFFLAPLALLGFLLFIGKDAGGAKPNNITITHKRQRW
jgi:hypothetical protein